MNMDEKVGNKRFTVYDSEADTVLELLNELGSLTNDVCDSLDNKTDLYGDHKGSWQGLNRPTMSDEGMRATVEDIIDNKIPSIETSLDNMKIKSIEDFGAIGDDNTDNTQAFKNAIEYFTSIEGGTLIVPKGVFQTSPFRCCDNMKIIGYGEESVLKVRDNHGDFYSFISVADKKNVTIENLKLDVNKDKNGGKVFTDGKDGTMAQILIYMYNSQNITVNKCEIIGCGVWIITCESTEAKPNNENIIITNNILKWSEGNSDRQPNLGSTKKKYDNTMIFMEGTNYVLSNNTFICEDGKGETAIEGHTGYGVITENYIENFNNGVLIVPNHWNIADSGYLAKRKMNTICSNNIIKGVNTGVRLWQMSTRDLDNVIVSNNIINLNPKFNKGVACMGISNLITSESFTKKIKNIQIDGNIIEYDIDDTVYSNSDHTINFSGIAFGFRTPIENIKISNNTIINSPATGIALVSYDNVTSKNIDITNNTIIDCGSNTNLQATDYNPKTAIRVTNNVENVAIGVNTIMDSDSKLKLTKIYHLPNDVQYTTPIINVSDTSFIKENVKYNFLPKLRFDSQSGTITTTSNNCYYVREGNKIKIHCDMTFTDKNITNGYGAYLQFPFSFIDETYTTIAHYSNINTSSSSLFIKGNKNTNVGNIYGNVPNGSIGAFTPSSINNSSKLVFDIEYDINFNNVILANLLKSL